MGITDGLLDFKAFSALYMQLEFKKRKDSMVKKQLSKLASSLSESLASHQSTTLMESFSTDSDESDTEEQALRAHGRLAYESDFVQRSRGTALKVSRTLCCSQTLASWVESLR